MNEDPSNQNKPKVWNTRVGDPTPDIPYPDSLDIADVVEKMRQERIRQAWKSGLAQARGWDPATRPKDLLDEP